MADGSRAFRRSYAGRLTSPLPSFRDVWRMARERTSTGKLAADAPAIPVEADRNLPTADPAGYAVTWVGHASFVLRIGGKTVLTDPVWSRRIPAVRPRLTPPGVAWSALPPVDAVVISHNHYDHLDAPTLRWLPRHTRILAPVGLGRWFRRRGFTAVTELDWWQSHRLGELELDFVPAHHWSRRGLFDTCRSLWGGWVITTPAGRIYFAGDTGYGRFFSEIGARYPGIDVALLPVGAYEPNWFMRPMHTNPEEAVQACDDVAAARMVPMHWGTFILSSEPVLEPLERTAKAWAAAGRSRADLWDLAVGETRSGRS